MGRKPTRNPNMPAGIRPRRRGNKVYYYFDLGGKPRKEIPLGSDYVLAVQEWAKLKISAAPRGDMITFRYVAERYVGEEIPKKAPRTQKDNHKELVWLYKFFDAEPVPLDDITPGNIRQYLDWRVRAAKEREVARNIERAIKKRPTLPIDPKLGHVRANREKALFSHIWNFARDKRLTAKSNPCIGIKAYKEEGRDVFVDDELLARLLEASAQPLRFAFRLAYLTGQRPADVYKMSETDVRSGVLFVTQGKGRAKLRIRIEGELKVLLEEMLEYKRQFTVRPLALIVTESGQPMNEYTMRTRIDAAREVAGIAKHELQFRDMRPKAATDVDEKDGTKEAQGLLGHTTEAMTTKYIRHKVGKLVKPTK